MGIKSKIIIIFLFFLLTGCVEAVKRTIDSGVQMYEIYRKIRQPIDTALYLKSKYECKKGDCIDGYGIKIWIEGHKI